MISSASRCFAWLVLSLGLVSAAPAARAPDDPHDLLRFLEPLWGKSVAAFPKAAKLKSAEFRFADASIADSGKQVIVPSESTRSRWTPKSLARAALAFEFDPKLGLVGVAGALQGTSADFDALLKEMNARYGQYATRTSALEVNTYGWVFPTATLSISSEGGAPVLFRVQINP